MNLKNKKVLITGASFIGSHLVPKLIKKGIKYLRIVNLTDTHKHYLGKQLHGIEFIERDLRSLDDALKSVKGMDIVIHLACNHGGRGYIETNQGRTASNLLLDGSVFYAGLRQNIGKIFYASSACVYPVSLQKDPDKKIFLKEDMVHTPYDADTMYGWGKLMGELTLKTYFKEYGLKSVIGRFFSVYGERASESHAVMATIAKAYVKQDSFLVWGDGKQIRNWTYIDDVCGGIILSLEKEEKAEAINFGTKDRIKVIDMINLVFNYTNFKPNKIKFIQMPTGPLNRVADNALAFQLLGWKPEYKFSEGLKRTIRWYFKSRLKSDRK